MHFELFNQHDVAATPTSDGPVVRVENGRLLLNQQAWLFMYQPLVTRYEVSLLFDPETRQAAIRPETEPAAAGDGTRWELQQMRGTTWPKAIDGRPFVEHYRIAAGEYPAQFMRGPGPRMVTFAVGQPQDKRRHSRAAGLARSDSWR